MATASISGSGTASVSQSGVSVSSDGTLDTGGLVDQALAFLDAHAPNFVKTMTNTAATVLATEAAVQAGVSAAMAALPAEMSAYVAAAVGAEAGAALAAVGTFAPVAAGVLAVPALLYAIVGAASGGTGCCGTEPYTRQGAIDFLSEEHKFETVFSSGSSFYVPSEADIRKLMLYSGQGATAGPCDPSHYSWDATCGTYTEAPAGSAEAFINGVIKGVYEADNGCWAVNIPQTIMAAMATAVGIWNRTHASQQTVGGKVVGPSTIYRVVNTTEVESFGGSVSAELGQAQDKEPLSVALNYAAMRWKVESGRALADGFLVLPSARAAIVVNEGAAIKPGTLPAGIASLQRIGSGGATGKAITSTAAPSAPAPVALRTAPTATGLAPVKVAAPVAWYDVQRPALGGATAKQAGIFGGAAVLGSWLLKRVLV